MRATEAREMAGALAVAAPLLEKVDQIDARLVEIKDEAKGLRGPLPKGEASERLVSWLRERRQRYEAPAGDRMTAHDLVAAVSRPDDGPRRSPRVAESEVLDFFAWLLGDRIDELVQEAVGRLEYREAAGSEERRRRGEELAEEREALLREREDLVERAREAGVAVEHEATTRQKRAAQAERQKREQDLLDQQQRIEAKVGPDVSVGRASRYLSNVHPGTSPDPAA